MRWGFRNNPRKNRGAFRSNSSSTGSCGNMVVRGWQYHQYAQNSNRYAYIGKDEETGEPEFLDYGPKGGR